MKCQHITIFTPSYNRAYILPKLYESLVNQTDKCFEWLIVDDGSSDGTDELVNDWLGDRKINIRYFRQENQGKHIAINTGLDNAHGELFFIVDSDDYLTLDAIEIIRNFWNNNIDNELYSGIISYRVFPDDRLVGTKLPKGLKHCKLRDCNSLYGSTGDKVVIYRTDIFGRFRYPKFKEERFFGESYVFNQIDDMYDMLILDAGVYRFDYQTDGLSQDFRKLYRDNPVGMRTSMIQSLKYSVGFKAKIKTLAHIGCLSLYLKQMSKYFASAPIYLSVPALPFSIILYIKIFLLKISDVKPFEESETKF